MISRKKNCNNKQVKGFLGKIGDMFNQELDKNPVKTQDETVYVCEFGDS